MNHTSQPFGAVLWKSDMHTPKEDRGRQFHNDARATLPRRLQPFAAPGKALPLHGKVGAGGVDGGRPVSNSDGRLGRKVRLMETSAHRARGAQPGFPQQRAQQHRSWQVTARDKWAAGGMVDAARDVRSGAGGSPTTTSMRAVAADAPGRTKAGEGACTSLHRKDLARVVTTLYRQKS